MGITEKWSQIQIQLFELHACTERSRSIPVKKQ